MKLKVILARLAEPSTWAGLAGLAMALGLSVDQFNAYVNAVAAICAVLAMLMAEGKESKTGEAGADE